MDDHPLNEPLEWLERIDACRGGSDDLRDELLAPLADELAADPRKRALFESVQQCDAAVTDAMEEVPVPAGLQNRLLAALANVEATEAEATETSLENRWVDEAVGAGDAQQTDPETLAQPVETPARKVSRRQLFWTALSVGTAASLGGVGLVASRYWLGKELSPARVLEETIAFHAQEVPVTLETSQPPRALPFSSAISKSLHYLGWRRVDNFLGRPNLNGIAFELERNGAQATLYVVPATVDTLKSWPLSRPDTTTAGRSISVWQGRSVMYVLVVNGDATAYRGFIKPSGVV